MSRFSDLPAAMRQLPVDHRGFPVPWFVAWQDGEPIFPAIHPESTVQAWFRKTCWVCGKGLGRAKVFVIGPMCGINRVSSEPPCHLDCARFSVRACPFLSRPAMGRVPLDHYGGTKETVPGIMEERNPGVTLLWHAVRPAIFNDGKGGALFDIGEPRKVEWFREGRTATRAEVDESIRTGLPALVQACELDDDPLAARAELARMVERFQPFLPAA